MKYYEIIIDNNIVAISTDFEFKIYNSVTNCVLPTILEQAQFIFAKNRLYHANWMAAIPNEFTNYTDATIIEIEQAEAQILSATLSDSEELIPYNPPIEYQAAPTVMENETAYINQLKYIHEAKINEMSRTCNQVIEAGFDLEIGGKVEHFSLTTQDQLNLISLSSMAANGMEAIPYHADGEVCRFYSNAEMQAIVAQATAFKIYHTTYYNALKNYINSLETIEEVAAVTYGMPLPEEYQSDVLKSLQQ